MAKRRFKASRYTYPKLEIRKGRLSTIGIGSADDFESYFSDDVDQTWLPIERSFGDFNHDRLLRAFMGSYDYNYFYDEHLEQLRLAGASEETYRFIEQEHLEHQEKMGISSDQLALVCRSGVTRVPEGKSTFFTSIPAIRFHTMESTRNLSGQTRRDLVSRLPVRIARMSSQLDGVMCFEVVRTGTLDQCTYLQTITTNDGGSTREVSLDRQFEVERVYVVEVRSNEVVASLEVRREMFCPEDSEPRYRAPYRDIYTLTHWWLEH